MGTATAYGLPETASEPGLAGSGTLHPQSNYFVGSIFPTSSPSNGKEISVEQGGSPQPSSSWPKNSAFHRHQGKEDETCYLLELC